MPKYTKHLQFPTKTKKEMLIRENNQCIFCTAGYHMNCRSPMLYTIKDAMHYIPKSSQGLGIKENGAIGCRYHHDLLDNGSRGLREEMLSIFKKYLQSHYHDWDETKLTYRKYKEV